MQVIPPGKAALLKARTAGRKHKGRWQTMGNREYAKLRD